MSTIIAGAAGLAATVEKKSEDALYKKIAFRVLPLIFIAYIVAYIDRINVGFAKLQFVQQLNFDEAIYGFGAGLFFLGYMLFELPSNILLEKIGGRLTLSRIMIIWGLVSAGMAFITTPMQFYVMRFLLGAAEAGFYPGLILYLSYWFPQNRRGRIVAMITIGGPLAGVFGSPLSGWLLTFKGVHGLAGWQVLFIYEGLPAVVLGVLAYFLMNDKPKDAKWLSPSEKTFIAGQFAADNVSKATRGTGTLLAMFRQSMIYIGAITYVALVSGTSSIGLWAPTIFKGMGIAPSMIGVLTAISYLASVPVMYFAARSSDLRLERRWHFAVCAAVSGTSFALLGLGAGNVALTVLLLSCASGGVWAAIPIFWAIPPACLPDNTRASGIAFIASIGALGGLISPAIVGWVTKQTGSLYSGLAVVGAMLLISAVVVLAGVDADRSRGKAAL